MNESKRKETFKKPFLILGLSFIALGCTLGISSLAWFSSPTTTASVSGLNGEATGSYFDGGTGVEGDPYIIANAKQLYYFAWLQDMGYFNEATSGEDSSTEETIPTTYFKIQDNISTIDASGYTLPPIGIEKYPFVGNFDANNCTITNLTIANKIGTGYISQYPSLLDTEGNSRLTLDEFNASQASIVGFFGIVGQYSGTPIASYDSEANEVKNLYLDEITIKTSDKSNLLIGIFAGYANGMIDNCGVHYAKMNINGASSKIDGFNNVSEYALIGSYNKTKFSWEETSGGDAGYSTSINIRTLNDNLVSYGQSDSGNGVIKAGVAIPFKEASNAQFTTKTGTISVGGRTVTNASTVSVSSTATNIGYYVGGTVASNVDTVATMRVFKDHYTSSNIDYDNISVSQNSDVQTVPDRVKTYLKNTVSGDVQQGHSVLRLGTPNTLSETMKSDSGYYGIESGKVGGYSGNILVPNNCIWVAPIQAGTFEFVCTTENARASWLYIWKLKRSEPQNYSSSLSTPDIDNQATNFNSDPSAEVVGMPVYPASSPYKAYYYGTPISEEDIENGVEFAIAVFGYQFMLPSIFITYIDIGSDGSGSTVTRTLNTTFDWVTKENDTLTKIKNADGTANSAYTKSNVFFEIGETEATRTFAWRRTTLNSQTLVLYYEYPASTTAIMTPVGSGSSSATSDDKCESEKS